MEYNRCPLSCLNNEPEAAYVLSLYSAYEKGHLPGSGGLAAETHLYRYCIETVAGMMAAARAAAIEHANSKRR